MILCTCYDFQHGHLCEHTHKVFHLHMQQQPVDDGGNTDAVTDTTDLPWPMKIGVTPPKAAQDETVCSCPEQWDTTKVWEGENPKQRKQKLA